LCERAFGKDPTQDGQVDMDALHDLMARLDIRKGDRVLDLGCGAGGIAEYIADETGAQVTGLDYAESAIRTALDRTDRKRDRLTFVQGDMNSLEFPAHSFDKILSLDTIYWVADIDVALTTIANLLRPNGKIAVYIAHTPLIDDHPNAHEPHGTWIAQSLVKLGLSYDVVDHTEDFLQFWPRVRKTALELKEDFVAEGNEVIFDSFMLDADEDYLPAAAAGKLRRYLYVIDAKK